ncbi:sensor histidine kinase [Neobacillus niacini]|uniref:sensor histidine kinase n=1 Tax=Neobacillus niacini TaxID=86668 RepID=UPI0005F001CC|nr:HAMP domain-containing sensor histidine kinase [Neobacillus niacini]
MIFLCLISIVLLIFFIYKNLNSRSIFFLCALTIGWILAYISFTLYLSNFNYYYKLVNQFFGFSPRTWNRLVLIYFNTNTLIRLFNFGIILFYFSFLSYSISFVSSLKANRRQRNIYITLGLIGICQFLFYDPSLNLLFQNYIVNAGILPQYQKFTHAADMLFQVVNIAYLLISFSLFIYHYILYYRLRYIRDHILFNLISLIPLTFVHLFIFYWAPSNFVRTTFSNSYINYLQPSINLYLLEYRFFPLIAFLAIGIMIFNVYKYKSNEARYSNINIITKKKIDTASLGIRAFTHAIKNHLLAIRSESEYLQEKFADDEEALYSLKLIMDSCEQSFQSINEANDKLKQITLKIKAAPLNIPVERAIERFHPNKLHVNIHYEKPYSHINVFIDEDQIQEAIYNILKNSIEALASRNGDIWVQISEVDQWGTVTIRDNGPGIDSENVNEIFTPFFSTKPSITNWGIGLSFCHKVITGHGGKIEVTSEKGKSTQFDILLPLVKRV